MGIQTQGRRIQTEGLGIQTQGRRIQTQGHVVQGVHGGAAQDRSWLPSVVPLQYLVLADSNFYAKYTYGNRSNRGIKLSHWNAGNATLKNKTNDIMNFLDQIKLN